MTTSSPTAFAHSILAKATEMEKRQPAVMTPTAKAAHEIMMEAAWKSAPRGLRFRNLTKSGAVLGVSIVTEQASGHKVTKLLKATGPWGLSEYIVPAHQVTSKIAGIWGKGAKRARLSRKADIRAGGRSGHFVGAKPLRTPYGPRFTAYVGATHGKGYWHKSVPAAERVAAMTYRREYLAQVIRPITKG
jgi:hypothetical protein